MEQGSPNTIHAGAQRAETMTIRGRDMDEGYIGLNDLFVEKHRNLMQENRNIVAPSLGHRLSHITAHEEGVCTEMVLVLRLGVFARTLGVHVAHGYALQLVALAVQGQVIQQGHWGGSSTLGKHRVT